jgi:hypothetical protein
MRTACLKLIVAVGVCLFASVPTHAQPLISHNETESIESVVANADLVVIGKLLKIGRGTPADERTLNVEGREKHEVTIAVEETLKHCISSPNERDEKIGLEAPYPGWVLRGWRNRASRLLVARSAGAPNESMTSNTSFTTIIELAPDTLQVLTEDMRLLHNPADVIRAARETVRRMPANVRRIQTFQLAVPWEIARGFKLPIPRETLRELRLTVPADERLEKRALDEIRSPNYWTREEGARALRFFKSDENIVRMKSFLRDPLFTDLEDPQENRGHEVREYGVRQAAYEALECWGVNVPTPVIEETIWNPDAVKHVFLREADLADGELKKLDRFKNLEGVTAMGIPIGDEHLKLISAFHNLRQVELDGGQVTDAGLKHLAALKDLHSLALGSPRLTDAGLKELASFANLDHLYLEKTGVTDAGLEHLAGLKKLTELDLGETRMTDAGLKHLAGLTDLCSLRLEDTQVADAGLKDLAPLKKLTELDLRGTRVTDAGLEVLAGFTNLEKLLLYKSLATDKGIAKLRKARPKLDVHF